MISLVFDVNRYENKKGILVLYVWLEKIIVY